MRHLELRRYTRATFLTAVLVGLLWAGTFQFVRADVQGPTPQDRQVTMAIVSLLKQFHLTHRDLDDEVSGRTLNGFLKTLDQFKVYFNQSDIDRFTERKNDLDNMARKGDISFAYDVFKTFLSRVDERVTWVDEYLAPDFSHDFTVDEELIIDPDLACYAKDEAEARDLWRRRIKYDLLDQKADGVSADEARQKLTRRYHAFARRMHQIDSEELSEMYLTSLTSSYDPHTNYMSRRSQENFDLSFKLKLKGIGAALQATDTYTMVSRIIPGGAADKAGELKQGDYVVGVAQGQGEMMDVSEMKLSDVVDMIRGEAGTVVRLEVIPAGQTEKKVYTITRAEVEIKDGEARGEIKEAGQKANGDPLKVGVINLPSFYLDMEAARLGNPNFKSATRDVRRLLDGFREQGVDAVVLDLRGNGGGSLPEAISMTGLFIDQGPIVQVKDSDGRVEHYDDVEQGVAWSGPLVVVIDKLSASASEILAGAIQDYGRGLVVGDHTTHGKGTVQSLLDIGERLFRMPNAPRLGSLKITQQKFYRPNGDSTQNRGVLADLELPSLTTHLEKISEQDLDYSMEFDKVDPAEYDRVHQVDRTVLDQLSKLSIERRKESEGFRKVNRQIEQYLRLKERTSVPLNEEKFMAQREEIRAERDENARIQERLEGAERPVFDMEDFYNQELLAITLDYLRLAKFAQRN
jgi:carboxyl-terminal processing protease